jgi:proteasome accessory factor A
VLARDLSLADPVRALHQVSADLSLARPLDLADGSTATALEIQWELFGAARKYAAEEGLASLGDDGGDDGVGALVMEHWEAVLSALEDDPSSMKDTLDWVAKKELLEAYQERHGCDWRDPRVAALALQYHDLRDAKSVYRRLDLRRLVEPAQIMSAVTEPPEGTRAWFRGKCLARWPEAVVTANWDSLVFDIGSDPLRRVPMMDPLKGTAEHTGALLAQSTGPADLLERLNA